MGYQLIAATIFAGDHLLKRHFDKTLGSKTEKMVWDDRIILRKHYNKGFIFDILADKPKIKHICWGIQLAILGVYWILLLLKKGNKGMKLGVAMVLGGGLSNLSDRIIKGHVVDYFSFNCRFPRLKNIVYNISDLFIFLGSILMFLAKSMDSKKHLVKNENKL